MNNYKACVNGNYIMTNQIRDILVQGETAPCSITFKVQKANLPEFCFLLYQRAGDPSPFIIPLDKLETESETELTFTPSTHFCAVAGAVAIELIACDTESPQEESAVVKLTEIATINVAPSMHDPQDPQPTEDIFTAYLTQFESLLAQTQEAERGAEQARDEAVQALSGLTQRVGDLETPAEISDGEIDDIFESEE